MNLGKFYIEDELTGDIWGKGPEGLRKCEALQDKYTEGLGYYVDDEEQEAYERTLESLEGFDTIEEAKKAAEPLINKKIPFLKISEFKQWDEAANYLLGRAALTDEKGERPKEGK